MELIGKKPETAAQKILKDKDYRPGDTRDHQYNPKRINMPTETQRGMYSLVYLVYAPELPGNSGEIRVKFPNKKQFNRVRRQLFFGRKSLKFKNQYGQPQGINLKNPYLMSWALEKFELSKESKIEMPSADFKVN